MGRMIKLLHFADLHLGVENYGRIDPSTGLSTRVLDFLHAFDRVVDYALENEVDLVIFAGDAYRTRDPTPRWRSAKCRSLIMSHLYQTTSTIPAAVIASSLVRRRMPNADKRTSSA